MPASLAELVFPDGSPSLYCPSSGRLVSSDEEGFDPGRAQSPHLRFVVDWAGSVLIVDPESLPQSQRGYQHKLIELLGDTDDRFADQNEMIAACVAAMPASCLVFEVLNPPEGSSDGEIAYFGFDLAPLNAGDLTDIHLHYLEDFDS
jgi:hypothetical protein